MARRVGWQDTGRRLAVALAALAVAVPAGAAAPAAKPAAAAAADVSATDHGFRLGSATAPHELVVYASLNCSHCASFEREAMAMIERAVAAGRLRYEWRPFLIFPNDPAPTLAARCMAPAQGLAFIRHYYATQGEQRERWNKAAGDPAWRAKAQALIDKGDDVAVTREIASKLDLAALTAPHGLDAPKLDSCIGDAAVGGWLSKAMETARADGVTGTPTVLLDGKKLAIASMADLARAIGEPEPAASPAHEGHQH